MARNYAALPHDYLREMSGLCDAEFGRLCRALLEYSANGTPIALRGNERFYAERVMMQEDRFRDIYEDKAASRKASGLRGANARWQTIANDSKAWQKCQSKTESKTESNGKYSAISPITLS